MLTVTQMLRKKGVVGKFVEFFGPGLTSMTLADRATIGNMAPEYGATCGFFPIDKETLAYLTTSARTSERVDLVEAYAKEQGLYRTKHTEDPGLHRRFSNSISPPSFPSMAGPKRPEGRIALPDVGAGFKVSLGSEYKKTENVDERFAVAGTDFHLGHGDVVIAAITSCTNTSNPSVLIGAGLLARKAAALGSEGEALGEDLARARQPGRRGISRQQSGLQEDLDKIGFNLDRFRLHDLHRQFRPASRPTSRRRSTTTGSSPRRFYPATATSRAASRPTCRRTTWLRRRWSWPMRIAGTVKLDLDTDPIGKGSDGQGRLPASDIWPTSEGDQ